MFRIYFYPRIKYKITEVANPYILNFISALSLRNIVVNNYYNQKGILDIAKFLFEIDIYLFNWIENLPLRRYGKIQVIVFYILLSVAKIVRKKVVWVLHNKYSHNEIRNRWINYMFSIMMKHSDLIITHSLEGIDFIKEKYPHCSAKVVYYVHPVKKVISIPLNLDPKYDFLIWGVILPYKGVLEFLKYANDSTEMKTLKILIVGKCPDKEYKSKLNRYLSENIIHLDTYFSLEEIANFANQAKFTLFTYKPESVLSSGSLMDSIGMNSLIIGPNIGAFKDLSSYGFVKTYDSFQDIINIYKNYKHDRNCIRAAIDSFCHENSWERFGEKVNKEFKILF